MRHSGFLLYDENKHLLDPDEDIQVIRTPGCMAWAGLVREGDEFVFKSWREAGYWDDGQELLENHRILSLLSFLCDEKHEVVLYGTSPSVGRFLVYDATRDGEYLDYEVLDAYCGVYVLEQAIITYRGPYKAWWPEPGFIKPLRERYAYEQRVVLAK